MDPEYCHVEIIVRNSQGESTTTFFRVKDVRWATEYSEPEEVDMIGYSMYSQPEDPKKITLSFSPERKTEEDSYASIVFNPERGQEV